MADYKQEAEYNIIRALESSESKGITHALLALTYAVLHHDETTRDLEQTLSRHIDAINRSTNFR